jgi:hypothetical protein
MAAFAGVRTKLGRTPDSKVAALHAPSARGRHRNAARAAPVQFQLFPFDDRLISQKGPLSRVR